MDPTLEEIEKFWKGLGLQPHIKIINVKYHSGIAMDGSGDSIEEYPAITLKNLYEYAIPLVRNLKGSGHPFTLSLVSGWGDTSGDYGCEITNWTLWLPGHHSSRYSLEFNQKPELAIFYAIKELLEVLNVT